MTRIDKRPPIRRSEKEPKPAGDKIVLKPAKLSAEQRKKYARLRRLMAEWMKDDSGQQERDWAIAEKLMRENPLSLREQDFG
ncbi:MAG TPA: hypothetical protein VG269_25550 [Tepidisphaeraceae bacterium]|jgi:hypothetical protein|nr:hypothetical protein [Tepidisphaeraceae bacterium]